MAFFKKHMVARPLSLRTLLLFSQPASKSAGWKFNSLKRVLLVSARVCALWPTAVLLLGLIYCVFVCNGSLMCMTCSCWCAERRQHQLCLSSLHLSLYCDADQVFFLCLQASRGINSKYFRGWWDQSASAERETHDHSFFGVPSHRSSCYLPQTSHEARLTNHQSALVFWTHLSAGVYHSKWTESGFWGNLGKCLLQFCQSIVYTVYDVTESFITAERCEANCSTKHSVCRHIYQKQIHNNTI